MRPRASSDPPLYRRGAKNALDDAVKLICRLADERHACKAGKVLSTKQHGCFRCDARECRQHHSTHSEEVIQEMITVIHNQGAMDERGKPEEHEKKEEN